MSADERHATSRRSVEPMGLTGTGPLLKVALRQDLRNIAPWVVLISALSASSILAYTWIFPDPKDRTELAATLAGNPALSVIFGPAGDLTTAVEALPLRERRSTNASIGMPRMADSFGA